MRIVSLANIFESTVLKLKIVRPVRRWPVRRWPTSTPSKLAQLDLIEIQDKKYWIESHYRTWSFWSKSREPVHFCRSLPTIFKPGVGIRFSGCGLRDRARGYRDSRDRAESHRARFFGPTRFLDNYFLRFISRLEIQVKNDLFFRGSRWILFCLFSFWV